MGASLIFNVIIHTQRKAVEEETLYSFSYFWSEDVTHKKMKGKSHFNTAGS